MHMHFRDGSIADSSGTVSHTSLKALLVSAVAVVHSFSEAQTHLWPVCPFHFLSQGLFYHHGGPLGLNTGLEV